jgi:hypothetical protein
MGYDNQYNYDPATGSYGGGYGNPMSTDPAYQTNNMSQPAFSGGMNPMNTLIQQLLTQQGGQSGYPQQQYSQQPQGGSLGGDLLGMGLKFGMKKFGPQIAGGIGNFLGMGGGAATTTGVTGALGSTGGAAGLAGGAGGGLMAALGPLALAAGGIKLGGEALDKFAPEVRQKLNKHTTGMFGGKAKNMLAPWKWRL